MADAPVVTPVTSAEPASVSQSWAEIFAPTPESSPAPSQTVAPTANTPTTPQPAAQPPVQADPVTQPFLKAGDTVYDSAEDAIQGLSHKDALIKQLRDAHIQQTGLDPFTGKQVGLPAVQPQQVQQPNAPVSYLNNPARFTADLQAAMNSGDPAAYMRVHAQAIQEQINASLGNYAPILQGTVKSQAIAQVNQQVEGFDKFINSSAYAKTLQANPSLARGIEAAEGNPAYAADLRDMYIMAHRLNEATLLSEAFKKQQSQTATPQAPARPTAAPTHATPGPQVGQIPNKNPMTMDTKERNEYLKAFESAGRDGRPY